QQQTQGGVNVTAASAAASAQGAPALGAQQRTAGTDTQAAPPALRAKGLDESEPTRGLTYSGPAEDGGTQMRRDSSGDDPSGTRRERRTAARKQKSAKKGSRTKGKR
ncbi:MAG: preprotein translocase subunit SecA, partial [Rhodococcus sp.]|nr:preprotein translocase subunit SecA [Rhodococcus sp. (in: high G+C Gram-positive bacteria)]